jgi:hypothetical protein
VVFDGEAVWEGRGTVGSGEVVGLVVFVVLGVVIHAVCKRRLDLKEGESGQAVTLSIFSKYVALNTVVVIFAIRSAVPSAPAGLAGLKKPQLELLGAALIVVAAESTIVFRSWRSRCEI